MLPFLALRLGVVLVLGFRCENEDDRIIPERTQTAVQPATRIAAPGQFAQTEGMPARKFVLRRHGEGFPRPALHVPAGCSRMYSSSSFLHLLLLPLLLGTEQLAV